MVTNIDRIALLDMMKTGEVQIVDVLPEAEFAEGHLPGALNIPLRALDENSTIVLDRGRPVAVY